jgi:hypothetical protein
MNVNTHIAIVYYQYYVHVKKKKKKAVVFVLEKIGVSMNQK